MCTTSLVLRKPVFGVLTSSDTNWAVKPQKMARGLKFRIGEVEALFYLCSKNKGADQLCSYRPANLCICFRICKMHIFSIFLQARFNETLTAVVTTYLEATVLSRIGENVINLSLSWNGKRTHS